MSNGTLRKIDELGRIVIPKDIRKSLSIKANDSLSMSIVGNSINIEKNKSIKTFDDVAIKYARLFEMCDVKLLVTNREEIIYNNSVIENINVKEIINMSLYDLIHKKEDIGINVDIRPIIIDSNPEGIVIVEHSSCNEIVGKLFNILLTDELDIT